VRRAPEHGVLHLVVRDHLQNFLWELDRREHERGTPLFVKREFQRFVRCGVLAHGFARFRCTGCGTDRVKSDALMDRSGKVFQFVIPILVVLVAAAGWMLFRIM
jgi:hypothetical protein